MVATARSIQITLTLLHYITLDFFGTFNNKLR